MNTHIFNVDENTFPVHRDRGFCSTGTIGMPLSDYQQVLDAPKKHSAIITDLKGTRPGDLAFFYEKGHGFHGVYQVITPPFFDPREICGVGDFAAHKVGADLPFRLLVRCTDFFPQPVSEDLIFSTPEYERIFWILFYRKIQGPRGCITIDPDAAHTLLKMLIKVNGAPVDREFHPWYYNTELDAFQIPASPGGIDLSGGDGGGDEEEGLQLLDFPLVAGEPVPLEDHLRGWLVSRLDDPTQRDLRRLFGPESHIEWFANNVPYHVAQRHIDILVYHRTPVGQLIDPPFRYRYSVVELKRDSASLDSVDQVIGYAKWVANRLADGETDSVRPYVIAPRFQSKAIERAKSIEFNRTGITLVKYEVIDSGQLTFSEL